MQLVKLIIPKRIKTLHCLILALLVSFVSTVQPVFSQDNSPYSRFGLGDLVSPSHIMNRGMGGIAAGYNDHVSINFSNPASYSAFQGIMEPKSKKLIMGRAILDVGLNFENRTLREPGTTKPKFTASNALFSYVQIGMPLKNNWGLSFGLRPISRISYKVQQNGRVLDAITGLPTTDSFRTLYEGTGGAYLASAGTGFSIFNKTDKKGSKKLSLGINAGYFFGSKDYSTRRSIINDTVLFYDGNFETKTNFGSLFFNAGMQYEVNWDNNKRRFVFGAAGNWGQKINASMDDIAETYVFDDNLGNLRLDSVSDRRDVKGKINIPTSYTIGFMYQKRPVVNTEGGWILGIDFSQQNWESYRFYGKTDSVRNSWQIRVGGQINPIPRTRNYFSNVSYRFGFFMGPDYIKVQNKLPILGASFGMGLPIRPSQQVPNQVTLINLAFEYGKRGNNDNILRENMFRFSLGFSLSDFWFGKRKYD